MVCTDAEGKSAEAAQGSHAFWLMTPCTCNRPWDRNKNDNNKKLAQGPQTFPSFPTADLRLVARREANRVTVPASGRLYESTLSSSSSNSSATEKATGRPKRMHGETETSQFVHGTAWMGGGKRRSSLERTGSTPSILGAASRRLDDGQLMADGASREGRESLAPGFTRRAQQQILSFFSGSNWNVQSRLQPSSFPYVRLTGRGGRRTGSNRGAGADAESVTGERHIHRFSLRSIVCISVIDNEGRSRRSNSELANKPAIQPARVWKQPYAHSRGRLRPVCPSSRQLARGPLPAPRGVASG